MSRLCLINPLRGAVPPNGYRYVDPVDGYISHQMDYRSWVEQQEKHLAANRREVPPDLKEQMEEQLCQTLPPGWCNYDHDNRPRPEMEVDWKDVLKGAQALSDWMLKGCKTVSAEEAERRATICTRCYLNVHMGGCSICQAAVNRLADKLHTTQDVHLRTCAACKCTLRMKVHFPNSILDKENPGVQKLYPEHCWLKKDGVNYRG